MIFAFGNFRVDDQRLELRDRETSVAVEPLVLETLIHLIRHRDRLVSKDELLREVWQTEHVSDSAISRCIMEARRAVGDNGARGEIIKTVHGRGYRFVADVEVVSQKPRTRTVPVLIALLGVAAALFVIVFLRERGTQTSATEESDTLAILSTVAGDDEELEWLAQAMEDLFRLTLASVDGLDLAGSSDSPEPTVEALLSRGEAGQQIDAVLTIELTPGEIEGFARILIRMTHQLNSGTRQQTPIASLVIPQLNPGRSPDRFDSIREVIAGMVVPRLVETLDARSAPANEREAWHLYLRALNRWEPTCEATALLDLLDRATELQPEFVPAWYMLGGIRMTQAKFCSGNVDAAERLEEVIETLKKLVPDSSTPDALRANLLLYQGETEQALIVLDQAAERFHDDLVLKIYRSTVLRYAGFLVASQRLFDEAVSQYPSLTYIAGLVPYAYRYRADWDGFRELMPGLESPHYRFYWGLAESVSGDPERAIAVLEPAFEAHPGDLYGRLSQAQLSILQGNREEARVMLDQLSRQRASQGSLDGEVTFEIGQLLVLSGDREAGIDQLSLAVDQGFFCGACLENDAALRSLAGIDRFDALVARARALQVDFAERFGLP
jgi:DNA-binding winged helix-turn-helix (wHTH) protein/tetratricopeptide (TPR) repeat protein